MSSNKRIPTDGGPSLSHNPFAALSSEGLPAVPESLPSESASPEPKPAKKNRGRVDIIRQKAGRGGKTVTVVKNFVGIGLPEKEQLSLVDRCEIVHCLHVGAILLAARRGLITG